MYLERVQFRPLPDETARRQALEAGDVDIIHTADAAAIETFQASDSFVTSLDGDGQEVVFQFNHEVPPFDDIRARRALTFATDRDAVISIWGRDIREPAESFFHESTRWHDPDISQPGYDPEAAAAEAAAYCADLPDQCTDGRIKMLYVYPGLDSSNDLLADVLREGWAEHFDVEYAPIPQAEYIVTMATGQYQLSITRTLGAPDPGAETFFISCDTIGDPVSLNMPRYCNPAVQAELDRQASSDDLDERISAWREVSRLYNEDFAYFFIAHAKWAIVRSPSVRGVDDSRLADGSPALDYDVGIHDLAQIWKS